MRTLLLHLALVSAALALTCHSGLTSNGGIAPSSTTTCPYSGYCYKEVQSSITTYGCDTGACVEDGIKNGQCKKIVNGWKLCCCTDTLCNSTGFSQVIAVITLVVASVFV